MKKLILFIFLAAGLLYVQSGQEEFYSDFNFKDINLNCFIIEDAGLKKEVYTFQNDVNKVMENEKIYLNDGDKLKITFLDNKCYVQIVRSREEVLKVLEKIPSKKIYKKSNNIYEQFSKVVQMGEPGLKEVIYKVTYLGEKEKSREIIYERILKKPVPQLILIGQKNKTVIASNIPQKPLKSYYMVATAYSYTGNNTFTGRYPKVGTIAVDPKIIPLGSKLWVEGYGYGIAEDIGSAIKGYKIDLFMETKKECLSWGRRKVKVYVLE